MKRCARAPSGGERGDERPEVLLPQSNDCPSPAERGIMKPFDRLHELALSDEALPDSGAGLLLGDKDASVREHCAAMAYTSGVFGGRL